MDEGKLFVGGIGWDTKEDTLGDYFSKYGEVTQAKIMKDKTTGNSRGFGFVVFSEPSILDSVLREKHAIDGRTVEVKRALSREEKQNLKSRDSGTDRSQTFSGPGNHKTKKIFVGGLPATLTNGEFVQYFRNYGDVTDVIIMFDQQTGRPRGFGFITFDTEEAVDKVMEKTFHELNNKLVEVKRALPKEANPGSGVRSRSLNSYSSHGVSSTFGSPMESKFPQIQSAAGSYPPYSCYGAFNYGYGFVGNSAFYGCYGFGDYGNMRDNYVGLASAYGDQTVANTSFFNSYAGLEKGLWSGYPLGPCALPYNVNAGYGAKSPWNSAPFGYPKSGTRKYGNQSYQNGNYRGSDVSYTDSNKNRTVSRRSTCMTKSSTTPDAGATENHGASNM